MYYLGLAVLVCHPGRVDVLLELGPIEETCNLIECKCTVRSIVLLPWLKVWLGRNIRHASSITEQSTPLGIKPSVLACLTESSHGFAVETMLAKTPSPPRCYTLLVPSFSTKGEGARNLGPPSVLAKHPNRRPQNDCFHAIRLMLRHTPLCQ